MELELLGRAAHTAYFETLIPGAFPAWEEQGPKIREAWRAAADAVVMLAGLSSDKP